MILVLAKAFPELSSRELALRIVDAEGLVCIREHHLPWPKTGGTDQAGGDSGFQGK